MSSENQTDLCPNCGLDCVALQSPCEWTPPTCKGFGMHHKVKSMVCIGLEDDGAVIWRCPKCLYVWSANADRPDTVGQA